jgi:hypothetical protein
MVLRKLGLLNRKSFIKNNKKQHEMFYCNKQKSYTMQKKFVLNRRVAQSICTTISLKLIMFPRPFASVKMVMQKVISNPLVVFNAFKLFKF